MLDEDKVSEAVANNRKKRGKLALDVPGHLNREIIAAIANEIEPDEIASAIKRLLNASRTLKNGVTVLPDFRAQEAGVKLALAYMVGMPVQRQEIVQVNVDADASDGMLERLKSSPALRDQLGKLLAEANDAGAVEVDSETVQK